MPRFERRGATGAFLLLAFAFATPGSAQPETDERGPGPAAAEAPAPSPPDEEAPRAPSSTEGIEELVILGEQVKLGQEDSTAILSFDAAVLEARGIEDLETLAFNVPNLFIGKSGTTPVITLRGLGATSAGFRTDEIVSIHVDGVYLKRPIQIQSFYDLETLDVRAGPQGTRYGRGSTAGSINFQTKVPGDEHAAYLDYTGGSFASTRVRGFLNTPITDTLFSRISLNFSQHDGYAKVRDSLNDPDKRPQTPGLDPEDRERLDDQKDVAVRGQLRWLAGEDVELQLSGNLYRQDFNGPAVKLIGDPVILQIVQGATTQPADRRKLDLNTVGHQENDFFGAYAKLFYDFELPVLGGTRLTGIAAYQGSRIRDRDSELDYTDADQFRRAFTDDDYDGLSGELRLNGEGEAAQWIFGLWYFQDAGKTISQTLSPNIAPLNRNILFRQQLRTRQYAVFGDFEYELLDGLSLRVGGRYDWTRKRGFAERRNLGGGLFGSPLGVGRTKDEWTGWSGGITLDWWLTENAHAFIEVSRGWKSGGLQLGLDGNNLEQFLLPAFGPETVNAVQAGVKGKYFDDRLRLNLTGFVYDYADLQFSFSQTTIIRTISLPEVLQYGVELDAEIAGVPIPWGEPLRINFAASALASEIREGTAFVPEPQGITLTSVPNTVRGNRLPNAPNYNITFGIEYEVELGRFGFLTPRLQVVHEGEVFFTIENFDESRNPPTTKLDVKLRWEHESRQFLVEAFVDNLTDQALIRRIDVSQQIGSASAPQLIEQFTSPRIAGARVGVRF